MSIIYNENKKQFYLHTVSSSYIIELLDGRIPIHRYWGKALHNIPTLGQYNCIHPGNSSVKDTGLEYPFATSDSLPFEFPCFGTGDMREPAFHAIYQDGSRVTNLQYVSHKIIRGKLILDGLPATYGTESEVETLEIELLDALTKLTVYLQYSVFEKCNAITRSAKLKNNSNNIINIQKIVSASIDFYDSDFVALSLHGDCNREFHINKAPLPYGITHFESKCGKSSHAQNPFSVLCRPYTTETLGEAYGFSFVYSGNFDISFEKNSIDLIRCLIGINSFDFSWKLNSNESFQTPEAVMIYSNNGLGQLSRNYHKLYRDNLCRGKYKHSHRPILINNWEATYFDFNEEKLINIATKARDLGIEMLVLDDGWFGERNADDSSLGDWNCNFNKLPNGLKGLSDKLKKMDMKFGIWMEPEMISPNSELYRKHPDWCIHIDGRKRNELRNQLVLDLSRNDVQEFVYNSVSNVLNSADISYLKWDMNRCLSDLGSAKLPAENQQELSHRYILGLYSILEKLTNKFPDVLFENCSTGGGRFDPGMMYYMPQTWCSDNSDAVERLYIQYGASMVYPTSSVTAHISVCPNHQIFRTTPLKMRGDVAFSGRLGYELDLTKISDDEAETIKQQIQFYKKYEDTIVNGNLFRIASPFEKSYAAWQYISKDGNTVILSTFIISGKTTSRDIQYLLQGLDPNAYYENIETKAKFSGEFLMNVGIRYTRHADYLSNLTVFKKII